jgi:hypothetical protein
MFQLEGLEEALRSLGAVLEARGLSYRVLAVGGSSLLLLGLIHRPTGDIDVVGIIEGGHYVKADPLPGPLAAAADDVGNALGLDEKWLNAGPTSLLDFGLPKGLEERLTVRRFGGLEVHVPGRPDQICFKLYAAADQGPLSKHFSDLVELSPSPEELMKAARWAITHDTSVAFRGELLGALNELGLEVDDADL